MDHAISHIGHHGIVSYDDCERAELFVYLLDGFEYHYASAHVKGAGRFIT